MANVWPQDINPPTAGGGPRAQVLTAEDYGELCMEGDLENEKD